MKKLFQFLIIVWPVFSIAQKADFIHTPENRIKQSTIRGMVDTATSNLIGFNIEDIQDPSNSNYVDLYYNVYVRLSNNSLNINKAVLRNAFTIDVNLLVEGDNSNGSATKTWTDTASLTISPYQDEAQLVYQFHKNNGISSRDLTNLQLVNVSVDLNAIDTTAKELASIDFELYVEFGRYHNLLDPQIFPKFYVGNSNSTAGELKENEAVIFWNHEVKPINYEIEWVHIPKTSPSTNQVIQFDFSNNSARVQTDKNYIPFSILYAPGYVIVRGRTKRPVVDSQNNTLLNVYEYGDWSLNNSGTINSSDPDVLIINYDASSVFGKMNWQYTASYSNESRKKELINFFDGSQRNRQSNTMLFNDDGNTLLYNNSGNSIVAPNDNTIPIKSTVFSQESYYDYIGNPVISVLPSPILSSNKVGFQDNINLESNNSKLTKVNYDDNSVSTVPQFSTSTDGAAQYYSPQNQLLGVEVNAQYISDANGYPYQRTEYMNDGSGRIKAQYGLGEEKALDDTKGTRYFYAKPTKPELEKLFGSNVGVVDFYKKEIAVDPNGVINISYVNHKGQTVATSIAGIPESRSNLGQIESDSVNFSVDLIATAGEQFLESEMSYELSYPIFVTSSSVYEFEYGFDIAPYMACSNVNVCFDCRYKLVFQIIDENNELVLEASDDEIEFTHVNCLSDAYSIDQIDYALTSTAAAFTGNKISLTLSAQKQYTIIKKLTLLQDQLEDDASFYIENSACDFKELVEFTQEELDSTKFEDCQTDYYTGDLYDPCYAVRDGLKDDFRWPNGAFTVGAAASDPFLPYVYNQMLKVPGCNDLAISYTEFVENAASLFGISSDASFAEFNDDYLNYLIHYHPTYCQLAVCEKYYTKESQKFDQMLEKSENANEFNVMLLNNGSISSVSEGYELPSNEMLRLVSNPYNSLDTVASDTALITYDPIMQFFIDSALIRDYENKIFTNDDEELYYSDNLNEVVRNCDFGLPLSKRRFYWSYFTSYQRGCRYDANADGFLDSSNTTRMAESMYSNVPVIEGIEDVRWEYYKQAYLHARQSLMNDVISSIVCFPKQIIDQIPIYGEDSETIIGYNPDTTLYNSLPIPPPCDTSATYIHPSYGVQQAQQYYNYSHFIGTGGTFAIGFGKHTNLFEYSDSIKLEKHQVRNAIGSQVYALLMYDSCISSDDSADFVNRIDSNLLICNTQAYLDTLTNSGGSRFLLCDPWSINFTPTLKPFMDYFGDQQGNKLFSCGSQFQDTYNCNDFQAAHQAFMAAKGASAVPVLSSITLADFSNPKQKIYANWMNNYLGLNQNYKGYYEFASNCTQDSLVSVLGDTMDWNNCSIEVKAIREAAIRYSDSSGSIYLNDHPDFLANLDLNVLDNSNYNQVSSFQYDYFGFGETDYYGNENTLYRLENFHSKKTDILDTISKVFESLSASLANLTPLEDYTGIAKTRRLDISNTPVSTISGIVIDRAYQYSDGTVWARVVDVNHDKFVTDYYYYYQPNNWLYQVDDITAFTDIKPILSGENVNYGTVSFSINSIAYEMVVKTSKPFAKAKKVANVLLSDIKGSAEFPYNETCEDIKYERALVLAKVNYNNYIEGKKDSFKLEYTNFCTNSGVQKSFTNQKLIMDYQFSERQFALYYYDQADNLVMTVPPEGVNTAFTVDNTKELEIDLHRQVGDAAVLPGHTRETKYKYNSNNQVIWQSTPNGGESQFWYDKVGRLVLSQNAEQENTGKFSYTLYDDQSRIEESGETVFSSILGNTWAEIHSTVVLELKNGNSYKLDSVIRNQSRNNVTKTFYDKEILINPPNNFSQDNLRSRVSTTAYYSNLDTSLNIQNWDYASHYSYDATGNVKTLVNDYYQNGLITNEYQRFKRIDYEFDVISGNVLMVYYQLGRDDAFYHRYAYDAENKITKTESSTDGIIWDEDANYDYYLHGPLARTELGQNKVQGIDYSYTIEGWLKAVNAGHHKSDIGNDNDKNSIFAEDAFGFSLNYHKNDYQSIGDVNAMLIGDQSDLTRSDLYNGNIASITKHNQTRTIGTEYQYDQLNRLKGMEERLVSTDSLKWEAGILSDGNSSFYEYDKNGNLLTLHREDGESGQMMDQLAYNYMVGNDQLTSVNDIVVDTLFSNDIDNQSSNNYEYDKIGNLTKDVAEGICEIRWYPNGKVKRIIRDHPTKDKAELFFEYDAMGNRVKKIVSFEEGGRTYRRATYYVRDASGNVMATYEERDCDYYEANDSTGVFYYQYGETFGYYTKMAISQTSADTVVGYLNDSSRFSKYHGLLNQSYLNLANVPGIRDSIIHRMNIADYFGLYPQAFQRVLIENGAFYANPFYNNELSEFAAMMNYQNEAYIQYLVENSKITDFYKDLDVLFANHGSSADISIFMNMNKSVLSGQLYNQTFISQYLDLSSAEYTEIINLIDNEATVDALQSWINEINESLMNSSEEIGDQLRKINALFLLVELSESELDYIFENADLSNFYGAFSWLPSELSSQLNTVLHHAYVLNNGTIDFSQLNTYDPTIAIQWLTDTNGDHLAQFLKVGVAHNSIIGIVDNYFNGITITGSSTYFDGSVLHPYAQAALEVHWQDTTLQSIILSKVTETKANLAITENLAYLMNYFKLFHPEKTILQNFYLDSINFALSGVGHYTPFDYAQELVNDLGVNFGPLGGCNPHLVYLVPEQYNIYGSSRLGTMNAKQRRKDAENKYSRKLGAKNYELSDHLGNVVATVSDKKIHPLELLVNGNYNVDTTIGFQADVTGRYDYYPFGMEIMSRSGSFTSIDYSGSTTHLIYNGLLNDCDLFSAIGDEISKECEAAQNAYGQQFVSSFKVIAENQVSFTIPIEIPLTDVIPNLDTSRHYQIDIELNGTEYREVTANIGAVQGIVISSSAGANASTGEIANASDKTVQFSFTGTEILQMANNGNLNVELLFEVPLEEEFSMNVNVLKIKVYEIENNTAVPFAKRMSKAYAYGFNGMERDDEVGGSGNSYNTEYRGYDSRLGRWKSIDPLAASFPGQSPYNGMDNNPIWNTDVNGDSTDYFNSAGDLIHQSTDDLENAIVAIPDNQIDRFDRALSFASDGNDNSVNAGLRKLGTGYAVDDFKSFFNENGYNQAEGYAEGYYNEHKTFLYLIDGLVRPGKENYPGDPKGVGGEGKDPYDPLNVLGDLHFHPNVGLRRIGGGTYTHRPSGPDVAGWKASDSPFHFDVVITSKYIYFINNVHSRSGIAVPFINTFKKGIVPYSPFSNDRSGKDKNYNPWGE